MRTSEQLTKIARALNQVETAGQARAAIGAALRALGGTYSLLSRLPRELEQSSRREMDAVRVTLEQNYERIIAPTGFAYRDEWTKTHRRPVERAYIVIAGVEAAAEWEPKTGLGDVLEQIIAETAAKVGKAAGSVARTAGEAAGAAAGGVGKGLGFGGIATVVIALAVLLVVVKRGAILGPLGRLGA